MRSDIASVFLYYWIISIIGSNSTIECLAFLPATTDAAASFLSSFGRTTANTGRIRRTKRSLLSSTSLRRRSTIPVFLSAGLIPEENPFGNPNALSKSGVRYGSVYAAIQELYPPQELDKRNAASRTDGYWPYIRKGEDPPQQFTYGEFDFFFFADLIDRAHDYYHRDDDEEATAAQATTEEGKKKDWKDKVFVDIGSGTGRLVLSSAALHPGWKQCRGIELLQSIHDVAEDNLEKCRHSKLLIDDTAERVQSKTNDNDNNEESFDDASHDNEAATTTMDEYYLSSPNNDSDDDDHDSDATVEKLPLAPVEFSCGSFEDPYVYFGDADVVFVFSSCLSPELVASLSKAIGRQCRPGTIIITTEYTLPLEGQIEPHEDDPTLPHGPYELELVEKIDGWCWLTGGASTAYVHRVVTSLWEEGIGPRTKPKLSVAEQAYRVVRALEAGELTDTDQFMRGVSNNIIFSGLPESWLPKTGG